MRRSGIFMPVFVQFCKGFFCQRIADIFEENAVACSFADFVVNSSALFNKFFAHFLQPVMYVGNGSEFGFPARQHIACIIQFYLDLLSQIVKN